jgi:periplasmic divalent cation tolerance protein
MTSALQARYSCRTRCEGSGLNSKSNVTVALTTCGSDDDADRLAEWLVDSRLAACVNIVSGVRSIYRWDGDIERGREVLLIIKTTADRLPAIDAGLKEQSGYELPEFVAVPVPLGSAAYLNWVAESVAD